MQPVLAQAVGQVTTGTLHHTAQLIDAAAQAAGDGVGKVKGDQHVVDLVHRLQQPLRLGGVAAPQFVQAATAHLAGGLAQPVQVGRVGYSQRFRLRDGVLRGEGQRDVRLDQFLERVLGVTGVSSSG